MRGNAGCDETACVGSDIGLAYCKALPLSPTMSIAHYCDLSFPSVVDVPRFAASRQESSQSVADKHARSGSPSSGQQNRWHNPLPTPPIL